MTSLYSKQILRSVFDETMISNIKRFAAEINASDADFFIVMARKAACFVQFLERCGLIYTDDRFITDRILDVDSTVWKGKKVVIVDDVVVSGTTVYGVIERLKKAQVASVEVIVLGVTEEICNKSIFDYEDSLGEKRNYISSPYEVFSEAACINTCSKIVSTFLLDITPYDVDFPRHAQIQTREKAFNSILNNPNWRSYDVASAIQSAHGIGNTTIIPSEYIQKRFDERAGVPVSQMGFFKIRIFARKVNNKTKPYIVNIVPYYLFNSITQTNVNRLYDAFFGNTINANLSSKSKIRLLQYVFAQKLLDVWLEDINGMYGKILSLENDVGSFLWVFPKSFYLPVIRAVEKVADVELDSTIVDNPQQDDVAVNDNRNPDEIINNSAVIKSRLMNLFVDLYHTTEIKARELVKNFGKKAFDDPEYTGIINRLHRGYSYRKLIELLSDLPSYYDRCTMVSLFLDEAIDVGIVVPIIQEDRSSGKVVFFRSYRHGEDVPFGEEEEKKCAILLKRLQDLCGDAALKKINIEKMLVLFIRIAVSNSLFSSTPGDQILYKVNIGAYLHGNIPYIENSSTVHTRTNIHNSQRYLVHRSDAVWLVDKLVEKGIIEREIDDNKNEKYIGIKDEINLSIDKSLTARISQISTTFSFLFNNRKTKTEPYVEDWDMVLFSTCYYTKDIINAMCAELAITADRWEVLQRDYRLEGKQLVDTYKADNLYISVNSGKKKFFSFVNKEAIKRIEEIGNLFQSKPETLLYADVWRSFWGEDKDWNEDSIGPVANNIITKAGLLLIWYNIVYRLLFACYAPDRLEQDQWIREARYICDYELSAYKRFSADKLTENVKQAVKRIYDSYNNNEDLTKWQTWVVKAINFMNNGQKIQLLNKVELFVDRHGRPAPIDIWGTVIYVPITAEAYCSISSSLSKYLYGLSDDIRILPEEESKRMIGGLWILLKARSDVKKHIPKILERIMRYDSRTIFIFTDLDDSLRIVSASKENTQYRYGRFWDYASTVLETYKSKLKKYHSKIGGKVNVVFSQVSIGKHNSDIERFLPKTHWSTLVPAFSETYDQLLDSKTRIKIISTETEEEKEMNDLINWYSTQKPMAVFISYATADSEKRGRVIAKVMRDYGIKVFFYGDEDLGLDMPEFMRRIDNQSDYVLILGSPEYVQKATSSVDLSSGVQFEDHIISKVFQSHGRGSIIPVIEEGSFDDQIPIPFNTLKGVKLEICTEDKVRDEIVLKLIRAYKNRIEKASRK